MELYTLTDDNFLLYAAKHYDNPGCHDVNEFYEDLNRIKYIKRLLNKYKEGGELKHRLILNHIITLYNVFGSPATTNMLFLKLNGYYEYIKPFLILLNYMPENSIKINNNVIYPNDIKLDSIIVEQLRNDMNVKI